MALVAAVLLVVACAAVADVVVVEEQANVGVAVAAELFVEIVTVHFASFFLFLFLDSYGVVRS